MKRPAIAAWGGRAGWLRRALVTFRACDAGATRRAPRARRRPRNRSRTETDAAPRVVPPQRLQGTATDAARCERRARPGPGSPPSISSPSRRSIGSAAIFDISSSCWKGDVRACSRQLEIRPPLFSILGTKVRCGVAGCDRVGWHRSRSGGDRVRERGRDATHRNDSRRRWLVLALTLAAIPSAGARAGEATE